MDYKYIEQLIDSYFACQTTPEEEKILREFFSQQEVPAQLARYKALFDYQTRERQVRLGIAAVRACALRHGAGGDMLLCGWSAGAHLAALALDCEGVVAGLGISGIYDLEPICHTALNQALQLQARDVARLSPRRLPVVAKPFVIAWGARELPQLQAQSLAFAEHRRQAPGRLLVLPEADHFSILDTLSQAENPMVQA